MPTTASCWHGVIASANSTPLLAEQEAPEEAQDTPPLRSLVNGNVESAAKKRPLAGLEGLEKEGRGYRFRCAGG